jgi:holo-[acyl-carrier protein] synthase
MRRKIFGHMDTASLSMESLAGMYAAKEAVIKTLDLKITDLPHISITHSPTRRPEVHFIGNLSGLRSKKHLLGIDISISHEKDYAFAVASALLSQ